MTKQEFKMVFDRHFDDIRAYVFYRSGDRDLATDIAQDVFLKFWEKQLNWEGKKTLGLLYKIASDEFISKYRKQKLEINYRKGLEFKIEYDSPDERMQYDEMKERYEKALEGLSDKQRTVFLMNRMDGLKYHEIADRLHISVKAVEKRMKLALRDLKKEFGCVMKKEQTYNQSSGSWEDFEKLPGKTKIVWDESPDQIWDKLEASLENQSPAKIVFLSRPVFRYAVAALIVLMISVAGLFRFYSRTIVTLPGEHLAVVLPDNSKVELNAGSSLKYYPLWWSFERKLTFKGEAFFEVEKGNKFVVKSDLGRIRVLGTSFNIFSRENVYRVNCISGKVQVTASQSKVILLPNQQAILNDEGSFNVQEKVAPESTISWINNEFFFTSVPLEQVIEEIERQYGVSINGPASIDLVYTGNFSRDQSVDEVLNLLGMSFDIKFVQKQKGEYQINQKK